MVKPEQQAGLNVWSLVEHYMAPISDLLNRDDLSEISANQYNDIWIKVLGSWEKTDITFESPRKLETFITQIGHALGQPVDSTTHPILDARLADGSRVCGVLESVSTNGPAFSIRVFPKKRFTSTQLVHFRALTQEMMDYLRLSVLARSNILLSGETDSGKTTLLSVLCGYIPKTERAVVVEDTVELHIDLPNLIRLEAPRRKRWKDQDKMEIDLPVLIQCSLRLNPDRLIVGEIRDGRSAKAFHDSINTGHSGTVCSLHANNCSDALYRLQTLMAETGELPYQVVYDQVRRNLQVLVHLRLIPGLGRRIVEIAEVRDCEPVLLWQHQAKTDEHEPNRSELDRSAVIQAAKEAGFLYEHKSQNTNKG